MKGIFAKGLERLVSRKGKQMKQLHILRHRILNGIIEVRIFRRGVIIAIIVELITSRIIRKNNYFF